MADIIKIGNYNVSCFKVGTSDCKIYLGTIKLYPQDSPTYDVCYAVVEDISQYSGTEFDDVYDKATEKWYKLNNLNQYEEYGIYGSGRNITYYEGKLTIDDGYEYQYSGSSWVNIGEISGSTAQLPNVSFSVNYNANEYNSSTKTLLKTSGQLVNTDAVITAGTPTVNNGYLTIASGTRASISGYQTYLNRDSSNPNLTIISKHKATAGYPHLFANRGGSSTYNWMYRPDTTQIKFHGSSQIAGVSVTTQPVIASVRVDSNSLLTFNNYTDNTSSTSASFTYGSTNPDGAALFAGYYNMGSEYFVGDFYWIYISQNTLTDAQVQQVIAYNEGGGQTEYPVYYDEIADPLDNLTFNTLEEAEAYACSTCVYDGMKATINGSKYIFDSEEGWVVVPEYYKVEDVTPNQASGWTISGSATYNPDSSYYDDFDLVTTSTSNSYKIAKVTIYGYDHFTYYLRAYHGYSTSYAYVTATNVDEISTPPTSIGYASQLAITNTYNFNKTPKSAVNLSNYRRVTYNNLDKTVEHTFYVYFYGRTYSSYIGNATILIPKEQTNENWEQVTFSASSNVVSAQKSLYIDGNSSTSGGTFYWYYRWMVGLPSGSHSSSTNYSSYDYCQNVTSSTFTSVAGEQRQVNFTYNNTSNKSLSFRLTDGSNVLTPSNTVYYNMTYYNSCGVSTSESNKALPFNKQLKVGGRFRFANSSNRHYIYGYSPNISLNYDYYVNNYQSTFDITYTKLSEEAVTIIYTTYDPNDSETPAFKTDITWPYNGGTTSSTTLTSYAVPYTYPYKVSQTSDKFSATTSSYSYTAGQSSRTISFTLYPNNREFSSVADLETYQYAWEGMKAKVGTTNYTYTNGQWVEQSYTQYEYIKSQASKIYDINTNFYPTTANTIEIKMEMTDTSVDWGRVICWANCNGDSCDASQFRFTTVTGSFAIIGRKGNTSGTTYKAIGKNKPITVKMPLSATTFTYNSGTTTDYSVNFNYNANWASYLPSSTAMHIWSLGGSNVSDSASRRSACCKIFYIKIYDASNNLIKHYVPSDNNGTPCFYEIVNGNYILDTYTGSNHGTLTLGPEV